MRQIILSILLCSMFIVGCSRLDNFSNTLYNNSTLSGKCYADYSKYKDISEKKFSVQLHIIQYAEFNDSENATTFFNTWSSDPAARIDNRIDGEGKYNYISYPIVIIAYRVDSNANTHKSIAVLCNSSGMLTENSKYIMLH